MNSFFAYFLRIFIPLPTLASVWLISYIGFDQTMLLSTVFSIVGGALAYKITAFFTTKSFLKKHGLTRREYRYIKRNLSEARKKMGRLNKALFSIRKISFFKQSLDLLRTSKKIYKLIKSEPKRFYQGEQFFYSHLDSVVELTEKYVLLSSQSQKNAEINEALTETRRTLNDLSRTLEQDLYDVLSNDVHTLNYELDVVKHSLKTIDDTRRLK